MLNPRKVLVAFAGCGLLLSAVCASAQSASRSTSSVQSWSTNRVLPAISGHAAVVAANKDPRLQQALALRDLKSGAVRPNAPAPATPVEWSISLGPKATSRGLPEGEFPAKYTANTTPSFPGACTSDFILFAISTPGTVSPAAGVQANLVGLNNLYAGANGSSCTGTAPNFAFSYAVDDGGIFLSPELSLDGKKAAFVVSSVSRHRALFEVLTLTTGQGTNATTGSVAPSAGALVSLDYTNARVPGCTGLLKADNFGSSPYIDYTSDGAFMGANNGRLYHVSGVFNGTPTVDFCTIVTTNSQLTSPVYDAQHGKIYISDGAKVFSYTFSSSTGFALSSSIQVGANKGYTNPSIVDSVAVDPFNGWVYIASAADVANAHPIISQMPLDLSSHVDLAIGSVPAAGYVLGANFDNNYLSTGPAGGSLYACGLSGSTSGVPALYAGNFNGSGVLNTTATLMGNANVNTSAQPAGHCSPIVTLSDGTNDRLYVGTGTGTNTTGSNLLTSWSINTPITSTSATPTASATGMLGGTSAFVLDYLKGGAPGTNGVYFGTRSTSTAAQCGSNNYCAIKVTQDALQ